VNVSAAGSNADGMPRSSPLLPIKKRKQNERKRKAVKKYKYYRIVKYTKIAEYFTVLIIQVHSETLRSCFSFFLNCFFL
jgi:hypothetical protein